MEKNVNEKEIGICLKWLGLQGCTKNVNKSRTSYGYKHIIERWSKTYISNDSFIEAVKLTGIPYKVIKYSPKNIFVALSEKTIKKYQ